jgi:hypothetical protein
MSHQVYVISAGRYNVLPFTNTQKANYIFCVKNGEKADYEKNGCKNVYETGSLIKSRNWALEHSFKNNNICVQLSDDLKKVKINEKLFKKSDVQIDEAIKKTVYLFEKTSGFYLLGIPPTDNDFFASKLISENTFCIGDCLFIKPSKPRFDERLSLKEDYDFTLQHIQMYGKCIRYQKFLYTFQHYKNVGGAVDYRTENKEIENINYLMAKWGSKIKLNPKRKNEIII